MISHSPRREKALEKRNQGALPGGRVVIITIFDAARKAKGGRRGKCIGGGQVEAGRGDRS